MGPDTLPSGTGVTTSNTGIHKGAAKLLEKKL